MGSIILAIILSITWMCLIKYFTATIVWTCVIGYFTIVGTLSYVSYGRWTKDGPNQNNWKWVFYLSATILVVSTLAFFCMWKAIRITI